MADDKRYYWLKLTDTFFDNDKIALIEGVRNGEKYLIFYLKLLCKSIKTEGILRINENLPYSDAMLAALTRTDIDIVVSAKEILIQLGLLEVWEDSTIHMTGTEEMIGSRGESAARVERFRERKKAAAIKAAQEKQALQCNNEVTECNETVTQKAVTSVTDVTLQSLQSNQDVRGKELDIRTKDIIAKDNISMTDKQSCNDCDMTQARTQAHDTPTHDIITYRDEDVIDCVRDFIDKTLRIKDIEAAVACSPDWWLGFLLKFEKVIYHPWSNKNLMDLQRADSELLHRVFDRIGHVCHGAECGAYNEIADFSKYIWTSLAKAVSEPRGLLCKLDRLELSTNLGRTDSAHYINRVEELKKRNPKAVFNVKYAVYKWWEFDSGGRGARRDTLHILPPKEISDEELLAMFNPFKEIILSSEGE